MLALKDGEIAIRSDSFGLNAGFRDPDGHRVRVEMSLEYLTDCLSAGSSREEQFDAVRRNASTIAAHALAKRHSWSIDGDWQVCRLHSSDCKRK